MERFTRLGAIAEYARGSLWVLPSLSVCAAIVLGVVLSSADTADERFYSELLFPGDAEGARGMLQALASSVITVTSLVFSLTIITLQLASSQFSPRLLRTFLRRPGNQVVMSVFLSTFVYSLVVLRTIRAGDGEEGFVPALAVTVAFLLVLGSVAALVYFIHHITTEIRADTLMQRAEEDTLNVLDHVHPDFVDLDETAPQAPDLPRGAVPIPSTRAGVVQAVSTDVLRHAAERGDAAVVVVVRVGDRVVRDAVLAWTWSHRQAGGVDVERMTADVNAGVTVGHERTMQQDVSYGVRQLVDMAAKALSTGVNDPTTASDATGHLASVLSVLARRRLVDTVITADGALQVYVPRRGFAEYLEIACGQIRRYGSGEPVVLLALLQLLRDVAEACVLEQQRDEVRAQLDRLLDTAQDNVAHPADLERVREVGELTRRVIEGERAMLVRHPTGT